MRFRHYKYYIFVSKLNETIKKNVLKVSKPNLILNFKILKKSSLILAKNIIKFCKAHHIPFYILNDIKIAKQLNAYGIYISANNKKISLSLFSNIKFELIGSAHNQFEYFIKQKQNCKTIMLSPIFYNNKYSQNKILNPIKFNLISLNWKTEVCALGGISNENIHKIKNTKVKSVGIKSWIYKK
jgi:thiamine monophosphate synthase